MRGGLLKGSLEEGLRILEGASGSLGVVVAAAAVAVVVVVEVVAVVVAVVEEEMIIMTIMIIIRIAVVITVLIPLKTGLTNNSSYHHRSGINCGTTVHGSMAANN